MNLFPLSKWEPLAEIKNRQNVLLSKTFLGIYTQRAENYSFECFHYKINWLFQDFTWFLEWIVQDFPRTRVPTDENVNRTSIKISSPGFSKLKLFQPTCFSESLHQPTYFLYKMGRFVGNIYYLFNQLLLRTFYGTHLTAIAFPVSLLWFCEII